MPDGLSNTKIFDQNGTKYRIGMDPHGYVQVQTGEMWYNEETEEDEFHAYDASDGLAPTVMFGPDTAQAVAEYIESIAA